MRLVLDDLSHLRGINRGKLYELGKRMVTRSANVDVARLERFLRQRLLKPLQHRRFASGLLSPILPKRFETVLPEGQPASFGQLELCEF